MKRAAAFPFLKRGWDQIFRAQYYARKTHREMEQLRQTLQTAHLDFAYRRDSELCWDRDLQATCKEIFAKIQPRGLIGGKFRVGRDRDGGYIVPADWAMIQTLVSLGVGDDNSFDLSFAERGVHVMAFDHTVSELPTSHRNIRLIREKVVGAVSCPGKSKSLPEILTALPPGVAAMKVDIEGEEYSCLSHCPESLLGRLVFMVLELHGVANRLANGAAGELSALFDRLGRHFFCFHVHANNAGGGRLLGGAFVPDLLEISFAHRSHYQPAEPESSPSTLDRPNDPARPEIWCGYL